MHVRFSMMAASALLLAAAGADAALSYDQAVGVIDTLLSSSTTDGGMICSFNITGNLTNATPTNTTGSVNISKAALNCTGGTLSLTGGPALMPYRDSFSGVDLRIDYNLPGAAISISDQALTIANSNFKDLTPSAEASIIFSASNVTIQAANFSGNIQASAAAIRASLGSNLAILNSTFRNNKGFSAGAISVTNSSLFVNGSVFNNNTGQQGGGILFQNGTQETLRVANTVFVNNRATTGGALFGQDCAQIIYYNNVFINNTASGSGGAIFLLGCGGNLVQNAVQYSNATAGGGAYINDVPDLSLWGNEWVNNTASVGAAAVDLQSVSNATIANDTYTGNAGQQGSAVFATATTCQFTSCTFNKNSATLNGGGIFRTQGSGAVSLCLFQNNTASKFGGAIYDVQVAGSMTGNVFSGNTAGSTAAAAVYRLQSTGSVSNNQGLSTSSNFQNAQPNSTTTAGR